MHKLFVIMLISVLFTGCKTNNYSQAYRMYCPNCNTMCRGYYEENTSLPTVIHTPNMTIVEHTKTVDDTRYMSVPPHKRPPVYVEIPAYDEDEKKAGKKHGYWLYQ